MNKIKSFNQLSEQERSQIEVLLKSGKSKAEIAVLLGRHISTIYREINRNTPKRGRGAKVYVASNAQLKTQNRHKQKPKAIRFTDSVKADVYKQIKEDKLSPELIAGSAKQSNCFSVSHETIYKWIWQCKHGNKQKDRKYKQLCKHLKHYGRRRKRKNSHDNRGCIQQRISIEKRPKIVNERKRIGDKEMDIVLGKNRKPGLLMLHDRKARMTWLEKIESKSADYIEKKINKMIRRCKHKVTSITTDNDLAFANHHKLDVKVYFTHPYSSFEKGSVENRIGVLRRFFPKQTDFSLVTKEDVRTVEQKLNNRPMKKFNFQTPLQQYFKFAFIT
jgi:transposase, IS30 family